MHCFHIATAWNVMSAAPPACPRCLPAPSIETPYACSSGNLGDCGGYPRTDVTPCTPAPCTPGMQCIIDGDPKLIASNEEPLPLLLIPPQKKVRGAPVLLF
jgi:hypothetical protein